jgi:hypothetical protein
VSDEVVEEYKEVLAGLHVRRGLIGRGPDPIRWTACLQDV